VADANANISIILPSCSTVPIHGSVATAGATSCNITVNNAERVATGDLLVLFANSGSSVTTITGGAGGTWTKFGSTVSTSNALTNLEIWYKTVEASDIGAVITVNFAISTQINLAFWGYRGKTLVMTNFQSTVENNFGDAAISGSTWTADRTGLQVAFAGHNTFTAGTTCTVTPTSFGRRTDQANAGLIGSVMAHDYTNLTSPCTAPTFTWTTNSTSRAVTQFLIAEASLNLYSLLLASL